VTVFLSTSYLDEADYLCNRVAILNQGKVMVVDTPERLKSLVGENLITCRLSSVSELEFVEGLEHRGWVKSVNKDDSSIVLRMQNGTVEVLDVVRLAKDHGIAISSIRSYTATLDDVLLHYTGRRTAGKDDD
jgi:ABC-2 type transport system ATP-binding protein